ncbi:MAG: hypothetical protein ACLFVB_10550 [Thermoplasmata archaeon]
MEKQVGGLVGISRDNDAETLNSYSFSSVDGYHRTGGLVGQRRGHLELPRA